MRFCVALYLVLLLCLLLLGAVVDWHNQLFLAFVSGLENVLGNVKIGRTMLLVL